MGITTALAMGFALPLFGTSADAATRSLRSPHAAFSVRWLTRAGVRCRLVLTQADVWATAVFVLGVDGIALLPAGYDAFVITNDRMTFATPGFDRYRMVPAT